MKKFDSNLAEIGLGLGRENSELQWEENTKDNLRRFRERARLRQLISNIFQPGVCEHDRL